MAYDPVTDNSLLGEDPTLETPTRQEETPPPIDKAEHTTSTFERFWEQIAHAGLLEPALRVGTLFISLTLVLVIVWLLRAFDVPAALAELPDTAKSAQAAAQLEPSPEPFGYISTLPPLVSSPSPSGVRRLASLHTTIPTRPRVDVITYTVQPGDSVFGIADQFGLKPESILWANTSTLQDNPHRLQVGQELNILPVDCTYH